MHHLSDTKGGGWVGLEWGGGGICFCRKKIQCLVDFLSNLTLYLENDLTLIKQAISDGYVYVIFTVKSGNINDTLKKWHNETAAAYQFKDMLLPDL